MKPELKNILEKAKKEIDKAKSKHLLQQLKSKFTGKKSELNNFLKKIGSLPQEERPLFGKQVNLVKNKILTLIEDRNTEIQKIQHRKLLKQEAVDITLPGHIRELGTLHPITKITREIEDIFISMGFDIAEGYDVEDEYHNFDALNTPPDHPARELSDTFYIKDDILLRTQTSTVQIRVMENYEPPFKLIAPGRCYRNDNDASHSPNFHQVEALVVDENIQFTDLRDILNIFVKKMFGEEFESPDPPTFLSIYRT